MNPFLMARRIVELGVQTAEGVSRAPEHVAAVWSQIEELVRRTRRLLDRADILAARMEHELDQVDAITREVAEDQVTRLRRLLDMYQPVLESLAPLGTEAAAALRPVHVRGLVSLLNELPNLVDQIQPALEGMGAMLPEMREVTDRMDNVGQVVEGLPGAKLLRRRGQAKEEQGDV
jgi:hypothetical protein